MVKTIDERLFEALMRAPHVARRLVSEAHFGEGGPGPDCHPGSRFGPGPMHGPGSHFGPGPMPGPGHRGHRARAAFARERLLRVIGDYEGGVRQKTLVEELKINPSSVSEMISKLESTGYVNRTIDPEDKRATLITLTELGEARRAELMDERSEIFTAAFSMLSDREKEQLIALLEKLNGK